jgi:capsular polysaccharide biosynthesis protein
VTLVCVVTAALAATVLSVAPGAAVLRVGPNSEERVLSATRQESGRGPRRGLTGALVALCIVLGALGGFLYYQVTPPVYRAETTVLVLPTAGGLDSSVGGGSAVTPVQIETEASVADSALVAADAAKALKNGTTTEELLSNTKVTVTPNSAVLTISYEADTAEKARDGSQAVAQAYLDRRSALAKASVDDAIKALDAQLETLNTAKDKDTKDLGDAAAAVQAAILSRSTSDRQKAESAKASAQANLDLHTAQIADINSRRIALDVTTTEGGTVISAAALPTEPESPILWIDVAAGAFIGALVGFGLLLLIERRRQQPAAAAVPVAYVEEPVTRAVPLPQPARVTPPPAPAPAIKAPVAKATAAAAAVPAVAAVSTPRGEDHDSGLQVLASLELTDSGTLADGELNALRQLCAAIDDRDEHPGPLVLVGVDYPALMNQAAFAMNEAWAAELGGNALVFTEPGVPTAPGRPTVGGRGLTDVLSGEWPALDTISPLEGTHSAVMGHGQGNADLPATTQRRRLDNLWSDLEGAYGSAMAQVQVPFDGTLSQSIMQTAGPILVVVKVGLSQQQDLAYAIEQLTWLGLSDHVVGVVSVAGTARTSAAAAPLTARKKAKAASGSKDKDSDAAPEPDAGTEPGNDDDALTPRGAGRGGA